MPNAKGESPLIEMANFNIDRTRGRDIFDLLISYPQVNVNATDNLQNTVLNRLVKTFLYKRAMRLFKRNDLDINIPDNNGNSPFMNLCIYKMLNSIDIFDKLLEDKNLDINKLNKNNRNALMESLIPYVTSSKTDEYGIKILIPNEISDNTRGMHIGNRDSYLPKKILTTKILTVPGIDLTVKDIDGNDVFDLAKKYLPEILPALEEYKENQNNQK